MRTLLIGVVALAIGSGCTFSRLERSILNQASTITELQYRQVLNNLAMLSVDPDALPAHVNLRDGSAQISDLGSLAAGAELSITSKGLPTLAGSRTVVEQWGITPITDTDELKLLRLAYRRALGHPDRMGRDLADDLAHSLCLQISNSDEIDLHNDLGFNLTLFNQLMPNIVATEPLHAPRPTPLDPDASPADLTRRVLVDQFNQFQHHRETIERINSWRDAINYNRVQTNDREIISDVEDIGALEPSYMLYREPADGQVYSFRPTPQAREARRQVRAAYNDVEEIRPGWFGVGTHRQIPPDAVYVGRFRDRYAWVCPAGCKALSDFTLKTLDFASLIKDQTILTIPGGGPRFTPAR